MTEDQIKHLVGRFLQWKLPKDFRPDAGIIYTPPNYTGAALENHYLSGTNLFDATQATEMVRFMVERMPDQSRRSAPSREDVGKHISVSKVTTDFCKRIHDENDHKLAADELVVRKICREFLELAADVADLQKARAALAGEPSPFHPGGLSRNVSGLDAAKREAESYVANADCCSPELVNLAEQFLEIFGEFDANVDRLKACEHIADGDEGWENLRNECPSTAAVARLRDLLGSTREEIVEECAKVADKDFPRNLGWIADGEKACAKRIASAIRALAKKPETISGPAAVI